MARRAAHTRSGSRTKTSIVSAVAAPGEDAVGADAASAPDEPLSDGFLRLLAPRLAPAAGLPAPGLLRRLRGLLHAPLGLGHGLRGALRQQRRRPRRLLQPLGRLLHPLLQRPLLPGRGPCALLPGLLRQGRLLPKQPIHLRLIGTPAHGGAALESVSNLMRNVRRGAAG
jgi:hypothetical protein